MSTMTFETFPFDVGYFYKSNPLYPDALPFQLSEDARTSLLFQVLDDRAREALKRYYEQGGYGSTPLGESDFSKRQARQILTVLERCLRENGLRIREANFLEIGCSHGYLLSQLQQAGAASVLGVEPGEEGVVGSQKYGVPVVRDFFPTVRVQGLFSCIFTHCVLEHVEMPVLFLTAMRQRLSDDGLIFVAVPDCEQKLAVGDISILSHQHINYFTRRSLKAVLEEAGLRDVVVESSRERSILYAWGRAKPKGDAISFPTQDEADARLDLSTVQQRLERNCACLQNLVDEAEANGKTIGLYGACSVLKGRLSFKNEPRLFDSDTAKQGKRMMGCESPIESPESLQKYPVDALFVCPIDYDEEIAVALRRLFSGQMISVKQLYEKASGIRYSVGSQPSLQPQTILSYGHQTIDEEDVRAVVAILRSDWLTQGPAVTAFEEALARYTGQAHAVVFANGTAALHAAYEALGIGEGDEFLTTPLTFAATANAGLWQGARPIFVDVDEETGNIDPALLEGAITARAKAIVPVDYAGHPCDMMAIRAVADRYRLPVLEDACHALGARLQDSHVGSLADVSVYSFHPVKPITTGEGGAVLTNNASLAERMRLFRSHGITRERLKRPSPGAYYHEMQSLGLNYRLTDLQCALGVSQLKKLDSFLAARREKAAWYQEVFRYHPSLRIPSERPGTTPGWHLYPLRVAGTWTDRRDEVFRLLREAGIGVQVHYLPVYRHPYYESLGYAQGLCPRAEAFSSTTFTLPLYPTLSKQDQSRIIETVLRIIH